MFRPAETAAASGKAVVLSGNDSHGEKAVSQDEGIGPVHAHSHSVTMQRTESESAQAHKAALGSLLRRPSSAQGLAFSCLLGIWVQRQHLKATESASVSPGHIAGPPELPTTEVACTLSSTWQFPLNISCLTTPLSRRPGPGHRLSHVA